MKTNLVPIICVAILFAFVLFVIGCFFWIIHKTEQIQLYPLTAVVMEFDYDNDLVTCIDGADNFWSFHGIEDWHMGDFVSMIMSDNGTPTIYDDIILQTEYAGYF